MPDMPMEKSPELEAVSLAIVETQRMAGKALFFGEGENGRRVQPTREQHNRGLLAGRRGGRGHIGNGGRVPPFFLGCNGGRMAG